MRLAIILLSIWGGVTAGPAVGAEKPAPGQPDPEYCARRDANPEKCVIQDGPPPPAIVRKKPPQSPPPPPPPKKPDPKIPPGKPASQ